MENFTSRENAMVKNTQKSVLIVVCFALILSGLNVSSLAQDEVKVLEEIAGTFEYEYEGQVLVVIYTVEDGVLYGTEENDPNPPSKLDPVEGKELVFETTGDDGNYYVISFSRDEEGKITKSVLAVMGLEIDGVKIKE
jgi:hypothetical protein